MHLDQSQRTRPLSDTERSTLEEALARSDNDKRKYQRALLGPSLTLVMLLGLVWAVIYWVGWRFLDLDLGLRSAAAPWMFGLGALALVIFAGPEVRRTYQRSHVTKQALVTDLASGTVDEMVLGIVEAIRLQEPEHRGFFYFLRTTDDRVYVQFDYDSQNLGVDDQDPESSLYQPCSTLTVVRARHDGRVLSTHFSGSPVPIVQKAMLTRQPTQWPEPDSFCSTAWTAIGSTFTT